MRCKWEFRVSAGRPPLDAVSVVIVGSAGPGFARRMGARGITVAQTSEQDPGKAVPHYLAGTLAPPAPHEHHHGHGDHDDACNCGG